ncbi:MULTISPECIES: type VI secretion system baseplate subunit TssK [unclassified Pseudomonas]|uniref:type VI secretion system baseplate subunit TssK n=1 Tax=unclassified Pseudomonas TaxID=196821 RepID=UPI002ACB081A|nr:MULTISPECIES: type VI secretion system baseplate subunit TssK [unclassified Pseudomonas]MEB0039070.1 type VI secretion system baseplate subunit TssK [Pseudomonas sp. MH10]MEB0092558.1 type VI secretion system baseplate subunit TssK [Pseudomonas sp. CCI4.2]MEB0122184.1 type VI secretion system baseplate subunit TssK [Pseudomonas sp. CCI1.2]WPX55185.1 type VI secretion system baseplate subunit TssK [Pseudomonas sp. CCI4.2]WPX62628.1 type VI secretion system baseplate subunit TssK [Pseudomonas
MNAHKVIWREGMLLRPQHFQHNDRYYDYQMKTRTQLLGRYMWGFLDLGIEADPLKQGKVVVSRATGILPDGSLFNLEGRVEPLMIQVPPNVGRTPVYLALPLVTGNHIEARADEDKDVLARYSIYDAPISNSNAGEGIASQVQCGRPDFRLLVGEQQSDQIFVKLKLCEVLDCTADGGVTLNGDFAPTVLHAKASTYLTGCLNEAIALVDTRCAALAERLSASGKAGGSEVGDFMLMQMMNRTQLILQHYEKLQHVHPEELYRTLLAVVGELSTFAGTDRRTPKTLRYVHSDLSQSFEALTNVFKHLMTMVLEEHATPLPLMPHEYGIQVAMVADHAHFDTSSFVLVASAYCSAEELRNRLPAQLKVGSVETIRNMVNLHLPGIKIRPLPVAPRQLAFHANKAYFIVDLTTEELTQLRRSGGFAFHVSSEIPDLELNFWAIKK